MATHLTSHGSVDAERPVVEFELSLWDALLLGRVSATRPGLRVSESNAMPHPNPPVVSHQEAV